MPTWAPTDTGRREGASHRPQQRQPGVRVVSPAACSPARSAIQRLTSGVAGAMARGHPGTRASGGAGEASAERQQVGASFRACARARAALSSLTFPARRVPSPPGARTSRPRAGFLSVSQSRTFPGASARAVASAVALAGRLSLSSSAPRLCLTLLLPPLPAPFPPFPSSTRSTERAWIRSERS